MLSRCWSSFFFLRKIELMYYTQMAFFPKSFPLNAPSNECVTLDSDQSRLNLKEQKWEHKCTRAAFGCYLLFNCCKSDSLVFPPFHPLACLFVYLLLIKCELVLKSSLCSNPLTKKNIRPKCARRKTMKTKICVSEYTAVCILKWIYGTFSIECAGW